MCAWYKKTFSQVTSKNIRDLFLNILLPYSALTIATLIAICGLILQSLNLIPSDKASLYFSTLAISLFFLNVTFITKFLNQITVITQENEPYQKYRETFIPDENYNEDGDLYYLYKDSLPYKLKINLVNELVMMLKSLKQHSTTRQLMPDQSFRMSIPLIKTLRMGDKIIAVDFLETEEWDDKKSESWRRYIAANEKAAEQGASVKRIFVINDKKAIEHKKNVDIEEMVKVWLSKEVNKIVDYKNSIAKDTFINKDEIVKEWLCTEINKIIDHKKIIDVEKTIDDEKLINEYLIKEVNKERSILKRHYNDPDGTGKMIGYYITKTHYDTIWQDDPQIASAIGDGFILLSIAGDKKKVAILDDFPGGQHSTIVSDGQNVLEYRTKVTFSDEVTDTLEDSYIKILEAKGINEKTGEIFNFCRPLYEIKSLA